MTAKNKIWRLVSSSTQPKAIAIVKKIFPSLVVEITDYDSTPPIIVEVDTKEEILHRLKLCLKKITEIEASYYLEKIEKKDKSSQIKF
jgi:hypothetical protein